VNAGNGLETMTGTTERLGVWRIVRLPMDCPRIPRSTATINVDDDSRVIARDIIDDESARLIAAAPKLLDALRWLGDHLDLCCDETEAGRVFRAAMSAAEGGAS
jgi:hypothetical protein